MENTAATRPGPPETALVVTVSFKTSQGVDTQATVLRLSPQMVVFEIFSPSSTIRLSELLTDLKIFASSRPIYSGSATVTALVNSGTGLVCEATLKDSEVDLAFFRLNSPKESVP